MGGERAMPDSSNAEERITNWQQFTKLVRYSNRPLLQRLEDFHEPILVAGCQRSGTTMLSQILNESAGMAHYGWGNSLELDGALILSGAVEYIPLSGSRYVFQTTYLDDHYREYIEHQGQFKLIWIIRNPASVIYSLLYNWPARSLEGTFNFYVLEKMKKIDQMMYSLIGSIWISRVRKACLLYKAKNSQLLRLVEAMGGKTIFVVDYDDLVQKKETILPQIYRFVGLEYGEEYLQKINNKSIDKKKQLSRQELGIIRQVAEPTYRNLRLLKSTI